jgi:Zn-dependent metalloprotease
MNMKNISKIQGELLEKLRSQLPELIVRWNEERGVASLLQGYLIPSQRIKEPDEILYAVLSEYGVLVGPQDVLKNHRSTGVRPAKKGGHCARAHQLFKGLPVYGATVLAFANEERGVYRVQSSFWREVKVTAEQELDEEDLQKRLYERLYRDPAASKFEATWKEEGKQDPWVTDHFPLVSRPVLYLHPEPEGFHPTYHVWAYQTTEWLGVDGKPRRTIERVELMFDAATGKVLWEEPVREGMAYTDTIGDGLSTLQDGNDNYLVRPLSIVQEDGGNHFLINRNHTPHIITHNAGGTDAGLENKLKNDTDISENADTHWNQTTASINDADREDAQQPEVDAHFHAEEAWNFYHNLGWDGFDDGGWGDHCPLRMVAHIGIDANACFDKYSEWDVNLGSNKYYGYLAFYDGLARGGNLYCDFMAGDPVVFGHEYQHAITFFGAAKANGDPGHLYGNDWLGAIREAFSDSLGCLRSGLWICPLFWKNGVLRSGQPFRRIEYPRSTDTDDGAWYCDHYDDRDAGKSKYFNSTILSHIAYLVGQGGIHERATRDAELIPVVSVGRERTAEIFIHALTEYYGTIPTNMAGPTLIEAGRLLLDAAEEVSGSDRSCEYVMMRRALYAVGLYPYDDAYNKQVYGGEACMLRWTISWRYSRPYLGFPALWYKSPDLFINNNGSPEYDAVVGQENKLFARVRNIGDQDLINVRVRFLYRRCGSNLPADMTAWMPCQNMAGVDCVLDIPLLPAGDMNFTDPNNPPADQGVDWYLAPAVVTEDVNHFCVRSVIECTASNNDNDCPNYVQSNIQHLTADEVDKLGVSMVVQSWRDEPALLDLRVEHTLPRDFGLKYAGKEPLEKIMLRYGEEHVLKWHISVPDPIPSQLLPPFEGRVLAKVYGEISGPFEGELSEVQVTRKFTDRAGRVTGIRLEGVISGCIGKVARVTGRLYGELDLGSGIIEGRVKGGAFFHRAMFVPNIKLGLEGCLEPIRAVHLTQFIDGEPAGGVTVHVKIPRFRGQCDPKEWH